MGTSLTGVKIKDSYDSLLKVTDNGPLDGSLQIITDGLGNNSALSLSTAGASVTGTLAVSGAATFSGALNGTLSTAAQTNITSVGTLSSLNVSGNVGIGGTPLSSYDTTLTIAGASVEGIDLVTGSTRMLSITAGGSSAIINMRQALPLIFETNDIERMRIDSSGNVGIGTSSKLNGYSSSFRTLSIHTPSGDFASILELAGNRSASSGNQNAMIQFWNKTSTAVETARISGDQASAVNSGNLTFYTASSGSLAERMRITSGGDVLVGRKNDAFTDNGHVLFANGGSYQVADGGACQLLKRKSSDGEIVRFYKDASQVGNISVTGSATAYNTSSDYRLKEDWIPMEGALDRVDALKPINFAWKSSGDRVDGFLAHELAEVVPEAVTGEKDATEIRSVEVSPAVYEDVIHPAEEAVYEEVIHEAVDAVYEEILHDAIAEELDEEGNVIVEAQEAWTEQILISEAQEEWIERVLVSEAKEEWVEKVLVSEAVFEDQEFPVYQGIDQSKIVPLLVAGLQEAHDLIKSLQARIEALKALS